MRRSSSNSSGENDTKKGRYCSPFMDEDATSGDRPVRSTIELLKLIRGIDGSDSTSSNRSITSVPCKISKLEQDTAKKVAVEEVPVLKVGPDPQEENDDDGDDTVLDSREDERYFTTVWCKKSARKHKKWEGDAVLIVRPQSVILKDMTGKEIGKAMGYKKSQLEELQEGKRLTIGGKEVELMDIISTETYKSGRCFELTPSPSSK